MFLSNFIFFISNPKRSLLLFVETMKLKSGISKCNLLRSNNILFQKNGGSPMSHRGLSAGIVPNNSSRKSEIKNKNHLTNNV